MWSARTSPDQERVEEPCDVTGEAIEITGYDSCIVLPEIAPVEEAAATTDAAATEDGAARLLQTTATTSGTFDLAEFDECVAVFLESCCTSTGTCEAKPIEAAGVITVADTTCENVVIMEEICGDSFTIGANASGLFFFSGIASILAIMAF